MSLSFNSNNGDFPDLVLRPRQEDHYKRIINILKTSPFYIDGSLMGTGKTFVALSVAMTYHLPVIVVCPNRAKSVWMNEISKYGIATYAVPDSGPLISYDLLRSRIGVVCKHGLLTRLDVRNKKGSIKPVFRTTELFRNLVHVGVMLILDEFQYIKNDSGNQKAVRELVRYICTRQSPSKVALLSGTSMCAEYQATNLFDTIGYIDKDYLKSAYARKDFSILGPILDKCIRIDKARTLEIMNSDMPVKSKMFHLFTDVVKTRTLSIMPCENFDASIKNKLHVIEPNDRENYYTGLRMLTGYEELIQKGGIGHIAKMMVLLQKGKMGAMAVAARKYLSGACKEGEICRKLILFVDYHEVVDYLLQALSDYSPREYTGRTASEGNTAIDMFQEPNDRCRLLIANPVTGGTSISLHDTHGGYPRAMFIMPNYKTISIHQAAYRIFRDSLKSKAKVRIFYGECEEVFFLNSMYRKGGVLQKVHDEQGIVFPNNYVMS